MTRTTRRLVAALSIGSALSAALSSPLFAAPPDAARDLRSKDPVVRLAVVETALRLGGKDAEATLLLALGNDDWEVVESAAAALATRGSKPTAARLVALSLEGPVRRVRLTAARAAAKLDVERTVALLARAAQTGDAVRAYEALAAIGESGPNAPAAELVDRGLDAGPRRAGDAGGPRAQAAVRAAAATALGAFGRADRTDRLSRLVADEDPSVACAALDASAASPDVALLGVLVGAPTGARECVERRLRTAIRTSIAARPRGTDAALAARPVFERLAAATSPDEVRRFVRIVAALAEPGDDGAPDEALADAAVTAICARMTDADASVRSAAAASLGRIRSPSATGALAGLAGRDTDAHVRLVAVHSLAACAKPRDADAVAAFTVLLADADSRVREEAAVALGIEDSSDSVAPLARALSKALADPASPDWTLASAALVSLGRTLQPAAVAPMRDALRTSADWRVRASAAAGLGRVTCKDAIPDLVDALDDKAPSVRRTALSALTRLGGTDVGADAKAWRAWWKEKADAFFFADHTSALREARMYGFAETASGVYEDLDVVLCSGPSGDDAHEVLDLQKIVYRTCKPGQLAATGLSPSSVVIGFTSDGSDADADTVEWFLHAGGLLAASAERLERVLTRGAPGCVRSAVPGDAHAPESLLPVAPAVPWSPYVTGTFGAGARSVRRGVAQSFVEVLDPDRVEVAIDSPPAAAAFGSADFACWLTAGHGTAVELGGGLDVSGVAYFAGANRADDRAAIAIDRMGLGYAEIRKLRERKVFDSAAKCAAEVVDLSSFRFVTNFVRAKRRAED